MPDSFGCFNLFSLFAKKKSPISIGEHKSSIPFKAIPQNLQLEIAKKMEFKDHIEFMLSSKYANYISKSVKTRITLEVGSVLLSSTPINGILIPKDFSKPYLLAGIEWITVKRSPNYPRICVSGPIFILKNVEKDYLDEFVNSGNFFGHNCSLAVTDNWRDIPTDVFLNLLDNFDVRTFMSRNKEFNEKLTHIQQFRELDNISLEHDVDPRHLSSFRASYIRIGCSSFFINEALNKYFKEWYDNKRTVKWLSVHLAAPAKFYFDIIFSDLPISCLWNVEKHKETSISHVKINHNCRSDITYYVLEKDEEKLWIALDKNVIQVDHVEDVNARMIREIEQRE